MVSSYLEHLLFKPVNGYFIKMITIVLYFSTNTFEQAEHLTAFNYDNYTEDVKV